MTDSPFDRLPPEMILKIFSYVSTKDLISQVQFVCKRFNVLVTNKQWWIVRMLVSFMFTIILKRFIIVVSPNYLERETSNRFRGRVHLFRFQRPPLF